jgi:MtN3 and saliva related transmembrane protein
MNMEQISGMDMLLDTGYIGGICTTIAFLPQVVKTWNSRSAHDLSWGLLFLLLIGVFLWMIYGIVSADIPVMLANGVTSIFIVSIVGMKWWFDHRNAP